VDRHAALVVGEAPVSAPGARVGIDIGGTFTDLVVVDDRTGAITVSKILTTPQNPAIAVADGFAMATLTGGVTPDRVTRVVHGTTLVTNAVVERKGARTGLVTTAGFRDTLEIQTENRYDMYDLGLEKPGPLVPRRLRAEVRERIHADGRIAEPLDRGSVGDVAALFRDAGVEAIAVCLLNSYRNGEHERAVAELLAAMLPGVPVALSSEVSPEIREYHRSVTTVVNAYVMPLVGRYVEELQRRLRANGFGGEVFLMLSNGGICTVDTARRFPVRLIESGPAAGALVAAHVGRVAGLPDLLSFDMGGTTAKACYIEHGTPLTSPGIEVAHVYRFKQGSGFPLQVRSIELIEIGAGGGSIARVDALGLLRVGPDSAGSDPGPACYGLGGTDPTVTDADLVLGYLDRDFFLGGKMALDLDGARRAILTHVGRPLGLAVTEAAWAIHRIVNENMASAARMHAIERGKNPEAYPLFAFGGAGPVHAVGVARILGVHRVVVPMAAGVASAAGLLAAPFAFDFVRSYRGRLDDLDWSRVAALYREMVDEGLAVLRRAGVPDHAVMVRRLCAVRYVGQGTELETEFPEGVPGPASAAPLRRAFEQTYRAHYRTVNADVAVEVLTWRVIVSGPAEPFHVRFERAAGAVRRKGERTIHLGADGDARVPVYDRYALAPGDRLAGPAVIEERESTTVVDRRAEVTVDAHGNLVIDLA
jgi:N-methylhydantoinase A